MRRSHLTVLAAVSLVSLVTTATSVYAVMPKMNLGLLKPQDQWKVGTVDADGSAYCAMVGKFDKRVVLAFARNPDGFGSIAMDFREQFFQPGAEYEVNLKAEGTRARQLVGRASSDRSVVVQIGQDEAFYQSLGSGSSLDIGMPTIEVSFSLRKFGNSYKKLVTCADQLSLPEKSDNESALAPIDREIERLSKERAQLTQATQEVSQMQQSVAQKSSGFDDMEAQLEQEAKAEAARSEKAMADIAAQERKIKADIAKAENAAPAAVASTAAVSKTVIDWTSPGKGEPQPAAAPVEPVQADTVADIEPAAGTVQAGPGRKLLAAMGSKAASFVGMSSGTTAREIEAREIAGINGQSPAATEEKTAWMKEQIAALEAEKRAAAEGQVAAFSNEQASLKSKEEKIQKTRDAKMAALSQSPEDKALKASLVAQQAKLAEVSAEKQRLSEELTQKLDATQTEYERRIAALEGERNDLRQQRDELKQQVASLAAEKALIEPAAGETAAERAKREQLEIQLKEVQDARNAEMLRAQKAQDELEAARAQVNELRSAADADRQRLADLQSSLEAERLKLAGLTTDRSESDAAVARLKEELAAAEKSRQADAARFEEEKTRLTSAAKTADEKAQMLVASERAELASLRTRIKDMEQELTAAKTRTATLEADYQASRAAAEAASAVSTAEIEKRSAELKEREDKLAADRKAFEGEKQEKLAAAVAVQPSPEAAAEIERLKNENRSLKERLTAFLSGGDKSAAKSDMLAADAAPAAAQAQADLPPSWLPSQQGRDEVNAAPAAKASPAAVAQEPAEEAPMLPAAQEASAEQLEVEPQEAVAAADMPAAPAEEAVESFDAPIVAVTQLPQRKPQRQEDPAVAAYMQATGFGGGKAPQPDSLNATEPAAGEAHTDKAVGNIFTRALGYRAKKSDSEANFPMPAVPTTPVTAEVTQALVETEASTGEKVVKVTPVVKVEPAKPSGISADDANRAAAFLDRVMAFHRPGGESLPALEPVSDAENAAIETAGLVKSVQTPDGEWIKVPAGKPADTASLSAIETAAGTPDIFDGAARAASAASTPAKAQPAKAAGPAMPLESLLKTAGVQNVGLTTPPTANGDVVRQWTFGGINGMYERTASQGGDFDAQVQSYLDRYRQDCPGNLAVSIGMAESTAAGMVTVADITCEMTGNAYTTSLVFLENREGFQSILHTAYPAEAAKVRGISDNIVFHLGRSSGIAVAGAGSTLPVAPQSPLMQQASYAPGVISPRPEAAPAAAKPQFRIQIQAPAAEPLPADAGAEFSTTVVQ